MVNESTPSAWIIYKISGLSLYRQLETYHVIDSDSLKFGPNLMLEDVVHTESVDSNILAHRDELGSTQIVERDIVMEHLGHTNDIGVGGRFTSRSDLIDQL